MITSLSTLRRLYSNNLEKMLEHRNRELEIWSFSRSAHIPSDIHFPEIFVPAPKTMIREAYPNPIKTYLNLQLKPGFHYLEFVH